MNMPNFIIKTCLIVFFLSLLNTCNLNTKKNTSKITELNDSDTIKNVFKNGDTLNDKNKVEILFDFENIKKQIINNLNFNPESKFYLIENFSKINRLDFFLFKELNNVCEMHYIATSQANKISKIICVKKMCDSELSAAEYEYFDYVLQNGKTVLVTKFSEKVVDKKLVDKDGYIINDLTRDDVILNRDTNTLKIKIENISNLKLEWPQINYPN